jgi:hypothetical protein
MRQAAEHTASKVQASTGCQIELQGDPQLDESSGKWLVAYAASGDNCDAATGMLRNAESSTGFLFYRRPTRAQVNALVARMLYSVESAFVCRFAVTGTPHFIEASGYWAIAYRASGGDCDGAEEELWRQGDELQIHFQRVPDRRELIQGGIPSLP